QKDLSTTKSCLIRRSVMPHVIRTFFMMLLCIPFMIPAQAQDSAQPQKETTTTPPRVVLETNLGDITLELNPEQAPITVANFLQYVDAGFYDDTIFHRVIAGFMIQGGRSEEHTSELQSRENLVCRL